MFRGKSFGCGSLIATVFLTVVIVAVGGFIAFNYYLSPYLNDVEIQELYSIYTQLSEDVNESEIVTNPVEAVDYETAKVKLTDSGIEIFDENGDIDPASIEEANFFANADVVLTDVELASVINEFISNSLNLEKVGIDPEDVGGLETQVLEVKIETVDGINVDLSFIIKLDMQEMQGQLGFFGLFLPDYLYIENSNQLQLVDGNYEFVTGSIEINNLTQEMNDKVFNVLVGALEVNDPSLTIQTINEGMGQLILDGIQEVSSTFGTIITFSDGAITFTPEPVVPTE